MQALVWRERRQQLMDAHVKYLGACTHLLSRLADLLVTHQDTLPAAQPALCDCMRTGSACASQRLHRGSMTAMPAPLQDLEAAPQMPNERLAQAILALHKPYMECHDAASGWLPACTGIAKTCSLIIVT